jgi:hypothetical protein
MNRIAILPTGDWAEVNSHDVVNYLTLDDIQFNALCNEASDKEIRRLNALLSPAEIDKVLGITCEMRGQMTQTGIVVGVAGVPVPEGVNTTHLEIAIEVALQTGDGLADSHISRAEHRHNIVAKTFEIIASGEIDGLSVDIDETIERLLKPTTDTAYMLNWLNNNRDHIRDENGACIADVFINYITDTKGNT